MSMKEDYQNYCERRAEFEKNPPVKKLDRAECALYGAISHVWKCVLCG